eukprot:TRINITY_DN8678_c1_g3_i1.p1 TRINITY_DN8678_c1_g3~~TRINITY_DN8678_c1_g3_i1.p1  ORF type:complete len:285 (-),score=43.02 TRINITY_DN8678_c1_g3_i1:29-883(-)
MVAGILRRHGAENLLDGWLATSYSQVWVERPPAYVNAVECKLHHCDVHPEQSSCRGFCRRRNEEIRQELAVRHANGADLEPDQTPTEGELYSPRPPTLRDAEQLLPPPMPTCRTRSCQAVGTQGLLGRPLESGARPPSLPEESPLSWESKPSIGQKPSLEGRTSRLMPASSSSPPSSSSSSSTAASQVAGPFTGARRLAFEKQEQIEEMRQQQQLVHEQQKIADQQAAMARQEASASSESSPSGLEISMEELPSPLALILTAEMMRTSATLRKSFLRRSVGSFL